MLEVLAAQQIEVLAYGVGGTAVPFLPYLLLRGHAIDILAQPGARYPPAFLDVALQRPGAVLDEDEDFPDIGVDAIAKREIDEPVFSGEGTAGLERTLVSGCNLSPLPPARIMVRTFSIFEAVLCGLP